MYNNILITGGAGFIGSNFIKRFLIKNTSNIINFDKLTYAGNLENLSEVENNSKYTFVKGDIVDKKSVEEVVERYSIDAIINFAAESHVDRSILDSSPFIDTNIKGTQILLDVAKQHNIQRFFQVSTDEVYGSLGDTGLFTENTPLAPNSPYSASKTSADLLVRAYHHTFGMDTVITRCSNNYGPLQFPEKLIPLMISNALENKELPVYGDGKQIRDWLHVDDHCDAIEQVLSYGKSGEVYNIGGNSEKENISIVKLILSHLGKSDELIKYVVDRPGHDRRYAIDASKIKNELNWEPKVKFEEGMKNTIEWYIENQDWVKRVKSGEYQKYYSLQYENR